MSWPEHNGRIFGFESREIVDVDCPMPDLVNVTLKNVMYSPDGEKLTRTGHDWFKFIGNGSSLILSWHSSIPRVGLESHYFDPREACDTAVIRCPGNLYPFDSVQECYDFLSTRPQMCLPNGEVDVGNAGINGIMQGDTVACRFVHLASSALRPSVHCAHLNATSIKCKAEQCPSAVSTETPRDLTPSFTATSPVWLRIVFGVGMIIFTLLEVVTYAWYRRSRALIVTPKSKTKKALASRQATDSKKNIHPQQTIESTNSGTSDRSLSIDNPSRSNCQYPVLTMEDVQFHWADGRGIINAPRFMLGGVKTTAIVAAVGAGKTTFMKLLAGFRLSHMQLEIGNYVTRPPTFLCHQNSDMWLDEMSVKDMLFFACTLYGSTFSDFLECFESLGVSALFDRTFGSLSGGQKQLVNIAATIVQPSPSLILLDEPMAAHDERKALSLLQTIKSLPVEHSFVMTVHMCTARVAQEFDRIVNFGEHEADYEISKAFQAVDESEFMSGHLTFEPEDSKASTAKEVTSSGSSGSVRFGTSFRRGVASTIILWHAQFHGLPVIEFIVFMADLVGGVMIGVMSHDVLYSSNTEYIPTEAALRLPFFMACCLMAITMVTSFGVPLVYGAREKRLIENFISQGALFPSSYVMTVLLRSFFFGCFQTLVFIGTFFPLIDLVKDNFDQIMTNVAFYVSVWTFLCSSVAQLIPTAYTAHIITNLGTFAFLFSGSIFAWESLHPFFKGIHYVNLLFYVCTNAAYLLLSVLDTNCGDQLLHFSQCASGLRVFDMTGMLQITSLEMLGVASAYFVFALVVMLLWLRAVPGGMHRKNSFRHNNKRSSSAGNTGKTPARPKPIARTARAPGSSVKPFSGGESSMDLSTYSV